MPGLFSSSLEDSEPVDVDSRKGVQALTFEERQTQSTQRIGDVVDLGEVNHLVGFRCVELNSVTLCGPNLVRVPQVAPLDGDRGGGHRKEIGKKKPRRRCPASLCKYAGVLSQHPHHSAVIEKCIICTLQREFRDSKDSEFCGNKNPGAGPGEIIICFSLLSSSPYEHLSP